MPEGTLRTFVVICLKLSVLVCAAAGGAAVDADARPVRGVDVATGSTAPLYEIELLAGTLTSVRRESGDNGEVSDGVSVLNVRTTTRPRFEVTPRWRPVSLRFVGAGHATARVTDEVLQTVRRCESSYKVGPPRRTTARATLVNLR